MSSEAREISQEQWDKIPNAFDLYAAWTDTVAKYPPTAEPFYLALGIVDEFGEMCDARGDENIIKEAGDTFWYCGRYCVRVLGIPFSVAIAEAMEQRREGMISPFVEAGLICGIEKKRIRDGADWSNETRINKDGKAYAALCRLMSCIIDRLDDMQTTVEQCLEINREKLSARLVAGTIQGDGDNR